jgi:hypothetical protein
MPQNITVVIIDSNSSLFLSFPLVGNLSEQPVKRNQRRIAAIPGKPQ